MYWGPGWTSCLAVSGLRHTAVCAQVHVGHTAQSSSYCIWNHIGKSVVKPLFSLSGCLFFSGSAFLVFCLPSIPPFVFFFFSSFFSFLSFHIYQSVTGAWMSLCVGAHGWLAGIASHGSVLLSRGWLMRVEAPGHPGHPPSTQLDVVVKYSFPFSLP